MKNSWVEARGVISFMTSSSGWLLGSRHPKECHDRGAHACKLPRPVDMTWPEFHHHATMNYKDGRK